MYWLNKYILIAYNYQINNYQAVEIYPNSRLAMQQQEKRVKQKKHQKLIELIKNQINTQQIGNDRVSYSFVQKQNESKTGYNQRLLILFHKKAIGYISKLDKKDLLPFQNINVIPKRKLQISIKQLSKAKRQKDKKQIFIMPFKKDGKEQLWQIKCATQDLSKSWVNLINNNIKELRNDQNNPAKDVFVDQPSQSQTMSPVKNKQDSQFQKSNSNKDKQKIEKQKSNMSKQNSQAKGQQRPASNLSKNQNQNNFGVNQGIKPPILTKQSQKLVQSRLIQQNKLTKNMSIQNNQLDPILQNKNERDQNSFPIFGQKQQQKQISKPISSLFVGGTQVNNEKDQVTLKNRMQTFQSITSKIKQQYERKKLQDKKIQEQVINQSNQFNLANLLSVATNVKFQIEIMQRQWGYQFANSHNEYEIVEKFKLYVQIVSNRIIDQLGLQQKKRYYQPQQTSNSCLKYQVNGVLFQIYLIQLKQISSNVKSFLDNGTILSNSEEKLAAHEFKNYDYILKLTHNKGKIRVPLSMINHYKGFAVYAKVLIPSAQAYDNMQKQLQILQAQSRINNSIFLDPEPQTVKLVALQSKVYQKLARAQNSNKKFDLCYIQGLKYYLPNDFNNFNKQKSHQRLRWELIQDDECQDQLFHGQDMCAVSSRLKIPQQLRDGINQLTQISKIIPQRIEGVAKLLESVDEHFTNSEQIAEIMHRYGVNMRYLGALLEKLKQNWLKEIIMSEISARCAKKYLNFDLQDCIINLNESTIDSVNKFQEKQLVKFLNKMLGNSNQTQIFWKQLNRQSQNQYKVSINRDELNQQYLLQALQYHCCFKLNDITANIQQKNKDKEIKNTGLSKVGSKIGIVNLSSLSSNTKAVNYNLQLFTSPNLFTTSSLACFTNRSKVYNLSFTQFYTSLNSLISQPSAESFQQIKILLNLTRTQYIPTHFKMSSMYQTIILFLINWISPKQMYGIYNPGDIQVGQILPSKLLYSIKLAQIRWALKDGDVEQSQKIKQWIVQHVNKWIGDCHPILTQLHQIYTNYYMMFKEQQKKAVNYCKNSIRNQEKLVGPNHQKMADSYYLLGTVYQNYGKISEAINCFKKSQDIIKKSNSTQSQAYGQVCLKIGQLYLAINQPMNGVQSGLQAINILQNCDNSDSFIQSIQLVCRCYQVQEDWQSYITLIQNNLVNQPVKFLDEIEIEQRLIKACILPNLKIIAQTNSFIAQKILKIISQLPQTTRAPNMAYNFLKVRIQQKIFPHRFLQALTDIEEILQQIQTNGMLARWKGFESLSNKSLLNKVGVNIQNKGFNFIACLQALNIFIGSSYIEGILLDL